MTAWKGFKELIVIDKVQEDDVTTSLYLKDLSGQELPHYQPGQFISVRVKTGEEEVSQARAYSLSSKSNGDYYRISIKKEDMGAVSPLLCDEVKAGDMLLSSAPVGKFYLKESVKPAILIGGGIGITPMLAMAQSLENVSRPVYFVYSTKNQNFHSFKDEILELKENFDNVNSTIFYTRPLGTEVEGKDYDVSGRISKEWMQENLPLHGDFYFCGPVPFMKTIYHNLVELGVDTESIHFEMFAPGVDITKRD